MFNPWKFEAITGQPMIMSSQACKSESLEIASPMLCLCGEVPNCRAERQVFKRPLRASF
jgi:hypothetical protein